MDFVNYIIAIVLLLLCVGIPVVLMFLYYVGPEMLLDKLFWKKHDESVERELKEENDYINAVLEKGVKAPADILAIHYLNRILKLGWGSPYKACVEFEVEVHPEGKPAFKSKFKWWIPYAQKNHHHEAIDKMLQQKIWVAYDPNDLTQIVFDMTDKTKRRNDFIDLEKEMIAIRETGEEAIASVFEVEDLDVANDDEKKNAKSMRLKFEVTPKNGLPFKSETYAMIDNESIKKLSIGKKFYIKFDRHNTEKSALVRSFE